jgi:hypothetical protein
MTRLLPVLLALLASPAPAQPNVAPCDWRAAAANIAEPWAENTRTFANGEVRLAKMDVGEPAAGGFHLFVLSPPREEMGHRQCRIVSYDDTIGFAAIDFYGLGATYDPARGLMFTLPVQIANDSATGFVDALLSVTVNQATGEIGTRVDLGFD